MIISSQTMEHQMVWQLMNDEMEDMEGNDCDLTEILSLNLLRGTEENHKNFRLSSQIYTCNNKVNNIYKNCKEHSNTTLTFHSCFILTYFCVYW
jgi:hypothetical protein